jgi:molybdate transport system substrate-binding protein
MFPLLLSITAEAAEIKVFSTIGVKSVLEELAPKFEQASGNKLIVTWSTGTLLAKRIQAGEIADVLIAGPKDIEGLAKEGKIVAGSPAVVSRLSFAVGAKEGGPKPDISTPEAFKQALLAANAITYTNPAAGGQSGVYFAKQLDRMGIAAQMKDKTKFPPAGGFAGALLVSGEADLAIQSKPELQSVNGVEVLGPLPGDMAFSATQTAAVCAGTKYPKAAMAFIEFLKSPEAQAAFKAKGYDPK